MVVRVQDTANIQSYREIMMPLSQVFPATDDTNILLLVVETELHSFSLLGPTMWTARSAAAD